jgi:hypothetical protein
VDGYLAVADLGDVVRTLGLRTDPGGTVALRTTGFAFDRVRELVGTTTVLPWTRQPAQTLGCGVPDVGRSASCWGRTDERRAPHHRGRSRTGKAANDSLRLPIVSVRVSIVFDDPVLQEQRYREGLEP